MRISIAIATYNGENFIRKQLDSILTQTYMPDEIIISDDASLDNTVGIIKEYIKEYSNIILLENKVNLGYVNNFKNAIEHTDGDIIFLSDQDDIWEEEKIESMLEIFKKHSHIKALSSAYSLIDADDIFIKKNKKKTGKLKNIKLKSFLKHPKYPGMAMAFRKGLWNEISENNYLDWNMLAAHDWGINYIAARRGALFYLDRQLVRYRQHDKNFSGIMQKQDKNLLKAKREKLIKELISNAGSVFTKNLVELNNLSKIISFQEQRLSLYQNEELLRLIFCELKNIKFISMRSILGDVYSLFYGRENKNG